MATTSTIGTARQAIVDAVDSGALAGNVYYAWPGPIANTKRELFWIDDVIGWSQEIPNSKSGRVQRQETYTLECVLFVASNELTSTGAKTCFERMLTLSAVVENVLANDVQLEKTAIQLLELRDDRDVRLVPFEKGWACQALLRIRGQARLT